MAFAETFKALSDPVRREILQLLKNGKMSAGEIGGHFDMTGATISYHLKNFEESRSCVGNEGKEFRVLRTEYHSCRGAASVAQ